MQLKYERAKHEIAGLKAQLRSDRKEAAIVIGNLQNQTDLLRHELEQERLSSEKLTQRNLELTERMRELSERA